MLSRCEEHAAEELCDDDGAKKERAEMRSEATEGRESQFHSLTSVFPCFLPDQLNVSWREKYGGVIVNTPVSV